MKIKNSLLNRIVPFLILGVSLVIAVATLILVFYLFVWGVLVGLALWAIITIKEKFFSSSKTFAYNQEGTVIEVEIEQPVEQASVKKTASKKYDQ